jgi:hypothetical protein
MNKEQPSAPYNGYDGHVASIITLLDQRDDRSLNSEKLCEELKISFQNLKPTLHQMGKDGLIKFSYEWCLTDRGKSVIANGSPEFRVYSRLGELKVDMEDIKRISRLDPAIDKRIDDETFNDGILYGVRKRWIIMTYQRGGQQPCCPYLNRCSVELQDITKQQLLAFMQGDPQVMHMLEEFRTRKFIYCTSVLVTKKN